MSNQRELAPCIIGTGTITQLRDMVRALETIESFEYRYVVEGRTISEGRGTLVKIIADADSATMLVNGYLFVNVSSFRYLHFETLPGGQARFTLHGDGSTLELVTEEPSAISNEPLLRSIEGLGFDATYVGLDDEDEED